MDPSLKQHFILHECVFLLVLPRTCEHYNSEIAYPKNVAVEMALSAKCLFHEMRSCIHIPSTCLKQWHVSFNPELMR